MAAAVAVVLAAPALIAAQAQDEPAQQDVPNDEPAQRDDYSARDGRLPAVKLQPTLGSYDRGERLAEELNCDSCHGRAGFGVEPGWPKLAGQHEQYLLNTMRNFRDGYRPHAFMESFAQRLDYRTLHDLALYYACQTANPGVEDSQRCTGDDDLLIGNDD